MSLVGNLEDLGLAEILQIVNISRRTGVLVLNSRSREGSIFFRQGLVVRATSSSNKESLGEVLIQRGVIDPAVLRKAISLQEEQGFHEWLGVILVKNFGVSLDVVEGVVREQIENTVFPFFAWVDGCYRFEALNNIESVVATRMDPLQFMLQQGLSPQFLAMEGARILAENCHLAETDFAENDTSKDAENISSDPVRESCAITHSTNSTAASINHIVIVDDDFPTLRALSDGLAEQGYVVHTLTRSDEALTKVDTLYRAGENPTVLIDLIMPKMDGSGVLGGIELLNILSNNFREMPLIVMTDYHHDDVETKVREMGYLYIIKPRRVEIKSAAILQNFFSQLLQYIPL
jgi:CheY-like chemotaxis protein